MSYRRAISVALILFPVTLLMICTSISIGAAATAVRLAWDSNLEPDLAGYVIRYGTRPGIFPEAIDVGNVTSYQIGGLPEGQRHYFVAVAYDDEGNGSPKSNEVIAVPFAVPNLLVSASAAPNPALPGKRLSYTLSYANLGSFSSPSVDASGVMITASVPDDTTFLWTTMGGLPSGSEVYWTLGDVPAGVAGAVHFAVQVDSSVQDGTPIILGDYRIDSNETTPFSGPAISTIVAAPVLQVTKTHVPAQFTAGGIAAYRITYSNLGSAKATNVVTTDLLPPETTFVWATNGGIQSGGVVTWIEDELPSGSTTHLHLLVLVSSQMQAGALITNGQYGVTSDEITFVTGAPDVATVIADSSLRVLEAIDEQTGSGYIISRGRHTVRITGAGFQNDAIVDLGPDIAVEAVIWMNSSRLDISIAVSEEALLGPRGLTVTNPNFGSASLVDALSVARSPDLNQNCITDGFDIDTMNSAFNTTPGEPGFIAAADLDGDKIVGPADIAIFLSYVGKVLPECP